jgi:hypothetical protein
MICGSDGMALESVEQARRVLASADYQSEKKMVASWEARIGKSAPNELDGVEAEIGKYFDNLGKSNPLVHSYVKIDRKALLEKIIEKRTGRKVIID